MYGDDSPLIWKAASVLRWEAERLQTWEQSSSSPGLKHLANQCVSERTERDLFYLHCQWTYYSVVAAGNHYVDMEWKTECMYAAVDSSKQNDFNEFSCSEEVFRKFWSRKLDTSFTQMEKKNQWNLIFPSPQQWLTWPRHYQTHVCLSELSKRTGQTEVTLAFDHNVGVGYYLSDLSSSSAPGQQLHHLRRIWR